jgi:hypothetical protein
MRPGNYDRQHEFRIQGAELRELKESDLPESFGPAATKRRRPTGRWATEAELAKAFEGSRKATITYLQTTNDGPLL